MIAAYRGRPDIHTMMGCFWSILVCVCVYAVCVCYALVGVSGDICSADTHSSYEPEEWITQLGQSQHSRQCSAVKSSDVNVSFVPKRMCEKHTESNEKKLILSPSRMS